MKVEHPAILIVEDDQNDQVLIKNAYRKLDIKVPVRFVNNGQEAIEYLNGEGEYGERSRFPFPTTIITDLKMPVMDGFTVLKHLEENPSWAVIPVVVLSASSDLDDIKNAFKVGAFAYHVKPTRPEDLRNQIKLLHDYWATSEIPQTDERGTQLATDSQGKLGERFA